MIDDGAQLLTERRDRYQSRQHSEHRAEHEVAEWNSDRARGNVDDTERRHRNDANGSNRQHAAGSQRSADFL